MRRRYCRAYEEVTKRESRPRRTTQFVVLALLLALGALNSGISRGYENPWESYENPWAEKSPYFFPKLDPKKLSIVKACPDGQQADDSMAKRSSQQENSRSRSPGFPSRGRRPP